MIKKITLIIGMLFIATIDVKAQANISFYNLGDYVSQTQNISPVFIPKNTLTIGLLNAGLNLNSTFKPNQLLVDNGSGKLKYDFKNLLASSKDVNNTAIDLNVNLFMAAYKFKKSAVTVFANLRSSSNWQYSKDFINIAANGISDFSLSNDKIGSTTYSEIGVGYTHTLLKDKLALAVRIKQLNGIAYAGTKDNAQLSLDIDKASSEWTINASNAGVNTSGIVLPEGKERSIIGNNTGFGFDFGATYKLTDKLTVELAVNDIGQIQWNDNVKNYTIKDATNTKFSGTNLNTKNDIGEEIESALNDVIGTTETSESFTTKLASSTFISAKYQLSDKNTFSAVYVNNPVLDKIKPAFGLGYNRTLSKSTFGAVIGAGGVDDKVKLGANFAVKVGPFQLYAATDDIFGMMNKVEESNFARINFGLNLVIGYKKWNTSKSKVTDSETKE